MPRTQSLGHYVPTWGPDLFKLNLRVATIMAASGPVIATRLGHFAADSNSAVSKRESTRMVSEKVEAAQQSGMILASTWSKMLLSGPRLVTDPQSANAVISSAISSAHRALGPYEKGVVANRKRLSSEDHSHR